MKTGPALRPDDEGGRCARARQRIFAGRTVIGLVGVCVGLLVIHPARYLGSNFWVVQIVSLGLVALGLGLRAWAAAFAGYHTRSDSIEAPQLATDGPYAHVRNPIYLGSIVLGLGMVGLLGDPWLLPLYVITLAVLFFAIIPAEEEFLRGRFGEDYARYCAAVPRLVPRLSAWRDAKKTASDWLPARGEVAVAALLLGIYVLLRAVAFAKATYFPGF